MEHGFRQRTIGFTRPSGPGRGAQFGLALLVMCALWLLPRISIGYHEAQEPADGTVHSFVAVDPPYAVPNIGFTDAEGKPVSFADFRGKVILLNLWATWCPPCIRELPALDRLEGRLGGRDFHVVAVSLDEEGAKPAAAFFKKLAIQHLILYADPGQGIGEVLPADVLPASFIIDRQGRVVSFLRSFADWDAASADELMRHWMAAP